MENVLMGNTFNQEGSEKFGEAPIETKRPIDDSSSRKPVEAPPFSGRGIVAEENKKSPTQPAAESPTDQPAEEPSKPNYLMIAGGLALLYFLFKRKK